MFKIALRFTLGRKLLLLCLLGGFLPLIIITISTFWQFRNYLKITAGGNSTSLAVEVMGSVEKTVRNVYLNIGLLADNPLIRLEEATEQEKLSEMEKMQDFYDIFEDITLIDPEGNVITSTTYLYRGTWKTKEYYLGAEAGATSISPVHIILTPPKTVLVSAAPVRDKTGKIIAVIAGQFNMENVWAISDKVTVGKEGFVFIVDGKGDFLFHPQKEKILSKVPYPQLMQEIYQSDTGMITYTDENGEKMIGGFASFSDPTLNKMGWKLIVVQPEGEALTLLNVYLGQSLGLFAGLFIFILLISRILSGSIVHPIKQLTDITKEIAAGKLEAKVTVRTGDEIEELANSFNQMTNNLKASQASLQQAKAFLEAKVAERTGELRERVGELEKVQKFMVGRELKMTELKKEIELLKKQLEK